MSCGIKSEVEFGSGSQNVGHLPCHGVVLSQRQPQEYTHPVYDYCHGMDGVFSLLCMLVELEIMSSCSPTRRWLRSGEQVFAVLNNSSSGVLPTLLYEREARTVYQSHAN